MIMELLWNYVILIILYHQQRFDNWASGKSETTIAIRGFLIIVHIVLLHWESIGI